MVIRGRKRNPGFTVVDNKWINDKRLSFKARGLMIYLCHLPEDWKLYASELQNHSTDGKDAIDTGLKELYKYGYLRRIGTKRNKDNRYRSYEYRLTEDPNSDFEDDERIESLKETQEYIASKQLKKEDGCGKSASDNPHLLNKDIGEPLKKVLQNKIEEVIPEFNLEEFSQELLDDV